MEALNTEIINQHLIDPEICIRCNTCEATCPIDAVTHNDDNYVVDAAICNLCMDCIAPCPTGAIDNWRKVVRAQAYSVEEQFEWEELPDEVTEQDLATASGAAVSAEVIELQPARQTDPAEQAAFDSGQYNARLPPRSPVTCA
jgi:benzoyl-CoA 2,3-dioxygenase component A